MSDPAGWSVVNVADAEWRCHPVFGASCRFEDPQAPYPHFGINVRVLQPGQPNSLYHAEAGQEAFLVLSGECDLIVAGQTRRLRAWDFVHLPPMTAHTLCGAGERPSAVLMAGARTAGEEILYPVDPAARAAAAAVERETRSAQEAYAPYLPPPQPGRPPGWDELPWA